MKRSRLIGAAVVTSCALPKFDIVPSFDDGSLAGASTAGGQGAGGKTNAGGSTALAGEDNASAGDSNSGGSRAGSATGGGGGVATMAGAPTDGGSADGGTDAGVSCTTPPFLTACDETCVDVNTDENNCGQCGKTCGANAECNDKACNCVGGTISCDDMCVLDNTAEHCGSCLNQCAGAEECANGTCKACPTGCAVLSASTAAFNDFAYFSVPINPTVNLNNTKLHIRLYPVKGQDVYFHLYIVNSDDKAAYSGLALGEAVGWTDLVVTITPGGGYDFSTVKQLALGLQGLEGSPANPSSIYVDSITVESGAFAPFDFIASSNPLAKLADSFNTGPSTVSSTISWLGN